MTRRQCLAALVAAPVLHAKARLKIGVMDGVLRLSGKPEAVAEAKRLGFEGLQVTLGRAGADGKLPLASTALQQRFVAEAKRCALPIDATYLDILHVNCLKNDAQAREWIRQGIEITHNLRARVLMTVFFGKCSLDNRAEIDAAADAFRAVARDAERAGVVLGFENLLKAEENLRVMERVGSKAFRIYYDVGNATNMVGVSAPDEIRKMGREAICQLHFKDKGYLGEGAVDFRAVLGALDDIGFDGYANLETSHPSGSPEKDLGRNVGYLRGLMT